MALIFLDYQPVHDVDSKRLKVNTSSLPLGTFGSVVIVFAATLCQTYTDSNPIFWNITNRINMDVYMYISVLLCWIRE
jgi:hypothetical protein